MGGGLASWESLLLLQLLFSAQTRLPFWILREAYCVFVSRGVFIETLKGESISS